ncbi:MAG: DNA polymerase III subunit gamma/tau [Bacteroidetes bacterium]|nr:DNA polymerase III subunit gamma/tau [Bacteroidota bacterium]
MDNFIVSARKYRPDSFHTVVGQAAITNTLKNAIKNNHLAQAFLFCGPRGVGKTTCARILAKTINCENLSENIEACNKCKSCVTFNESSSFNVHELDAASNNSVDDIRSLVEQVRIPPQYGKYKVYIIDEVHMLSSQAFNAFLKTLEEPPTYAKFILATTEKHKIIPTILSRCQIFDFKRITIEDIAKHLAFVAESETITADSDALHIIAQKADGALRDALSMFDQIVSFAGDNVSYNSVIENLNVLDYEYYFKITDFIYENNISDTLLLVNEIFDKGFDGHHFINGLSEHIRNLLVCKDTATIKLLEVGASIKDKYKDQSQKCPQSLLINLLEISNKADYQYKSISNKRFFVELALLQMCSLSQNPPSDSVEKSAPLIQTKPIINTVVTEKTETYSKPQVATPVVTAAPVNKVVSESSTAGKSMPNAFNTISIKKSAVPSEEIKEIAEVQEQIIESTEYFDQRQLEAAWKSFSEKYSHDNPSFHSTLNKRKPLLENNFVISFGIDNKIEEDDFNLKRYEIQAFLRNELKNGKIELQSSYATGDTLTTKPFTANEKYQVMNDKNPNIGKLREQLDLEIDL